MKNKIIKYMACAAVALGLAANVQAAQITGGISLSGNYAMNGADFNTATAFTSFNMVQITSVSGSYAGILGSFAAINPFSFGSGVGNVPVSVIPLWITTPFGTSLYAFDLTSMNVDSRTADTLNLSGRGTLHISPDINGVTWTDTAGAWVFTGNTLGGTFSWSSSNGALVPDGGTTALLLGAAISALRLIRRKLA